MDKETRELLTRQMLKEWEYKTNRECLYDRMRKSRANSRSSRSKLVTHPNKEARRPTASDEWRAHRQASSLAMSRDSSCEVTAFEEFSLCSEASYAEASCKSYDGGPLFSPRSVLRLESTDSIFVPTQAV